MDPFTRYIFGMYKGRQEAMRKRREQSGRYAWMTPAEIKAKKARRRKNRRAHRARMVTLKSR